MGNNNTEDVQDDELEDERLDDLLGNEDDQQDGENPPAQPSGEGEGDNPPTAPSQADDQNPNEGEDDEPKEGVDPKDLAIQNLRNQNRRLQKALKKSNPDANIVPRRTPTGQPLYDRFLNNEFRTATMFAAQTDPTIMARIPIIKKIMFEEMPELLEKPNGFELANDLAKGRTIKVTVTSKKDAELQPQTSPARPAGAGPKVKRLTQDEYNKLSEDQRVAYENSLMGQ